MPEREVRAPRVPGELPNGPGEPGGGRGTDRDLVSELLGRATAALARSLTTMPPRQQSRLLQAAAGEDVLVAAAMQPSVVGHARLASPLLPALLRGAQARRQLLEADGGTLSAAEVARLLRRTRQAVDKQRRVGRLFAVRVGPSWRYPAWQFVDGELLPGLPDVLAALRHVSPWAAAAFLLSRNARLGARRPLDVLRHGEIDAVTRAARAYGEHGAA
jgi:hypothetical protein